jgi:hypothetical protein
MPLNIEWTVFVAQLIYLEKKWCFDQSRTCILAGIKLGCFFWHQNKVVCGMMFAPTMTQEMTLEEYEKVLEEKWKALLSLKAE